MPKIAHDQLKKYAAAVMLKLGSEEDEACCIAHHLVTSNLKGHDSHGIGMMPTYVDYCSGGLMNVNQPIHVARDAGAVLSIDGKCGMGQRVGRDAMKLAIERAQQNGICLMALRNTSHLGRIGTYGEQAVREGLVAINFVNVADHDALQSVFAGGDARLGTNPICIAMPTVLPIRSDADWIVLDMATSNIALGKARVARNKGVELPPGSMIDGAGRPTLDPRPMVDERIGALLPFGGHKGSGLAVICELLAGGLTGGLSIQPENDRRGGIINNMLTILIRPDAFDAGSSVMHELSAIRQWVKDSPAAPGHDAVLVPGEPEKIFMADRLENGIPIDRTTFDELHTCAVKAGVERSEVAELLKEL